MTDASQESTQRDYFEAADARRFRWTTTAPGFAETEDELLEPVAGQLTSPLLEIGCGEGNNLVRFGDIARRTGVDLFPKKLAFAARELEHCCFATADGQALPFADASFGSVFVRDLLHHVEQPRRVLAEVARVLAPGGRFVLLEPNGRNPLIWLQTRLVPAEVGARDFSPEFVLGLFRDLPFRQPDVALRQPIALRRAVLHYEKGLPALGASPLGRALLRAGERVVGAVLPRSRWTYVQITAQRESS